MVAPVQSKAPSKALGQYLPLTATTEPLGTIPLLVLPAPWSPWESDRLWTDAMSFPSSPTPHLCTVWRPWLSTQDWKSLLPALSAAGPDPSFVICLWASSISSWKCSSPHQLGQHCLGKGEIWDMSSQGRAMGPSRSWAPQRLLAPALSTQGKRGSPT